MKGEAMKWELCKVEVEVHSTHAPLTVELVEKLLDKIMDPGLEAMDFWRKLGIEEPVLAMAPLELFAEGMKKAFPTYMGKG